MADQPSTATPPAQPVFSIEKVYVKDMSLEVPNAPQVFVENAQPQVDVELGTQHAQMADGLFESTLTITVTAKLAEKTFFLVECAQSGIFQIRNFPEQDLAAVLGIGCPSVLFPYAREAVSSMVNRAGFPPINLAPVNFEQLFVQQLQQQQQQQQGQAGPKIEIAH